ncbi:glycosyltransferase family 39 protein [Spirillospora sp. NPDC050679]
MVQDTTRGGAAAEAAPGAAPDGAGRRARAAAFARRRVVWLSALVAACGVVAQWVVMVPPLYFDPYYVWLGARDWPDVPLESWPFNEVPHQVTRLGLVLPARVAQELLGPGQAAYFAVAALGGALFFVGCYLAVRSLFGDAAGVLAALLLIVHPLFTMTNPFGHEITWSAGVMLPDMPGAGLFALGMAALVAASRRAGRAQARLLVAAGLLFGSSFLVREFLAFLFLAIPAYLAILRIPWRRNVIVGLPMAAILAANLAHNQIVWGNPLAGLRSAATHGGKSRDYVTRELAAKSFLRAMHDWHPLGTVFVALLALTLLGWLVTRDRRLALCLVWFGMLAVPLTLLSGVLDPEDISLRAWLPRYWFAVFPALLAGGFGAVALLARRLLPAGRRVAGLALPTASLAALAVVLGSAYTVSAVRAVPDLPRDTAWNELRAWFADGRGDGIRKISADRRLGQTLTFYTRTVWGEPLWKGEINDFPHDMPQQPPGDSPMLFTKWRGSEASAPVLAGWEPGKAGWRRLWKSSDGILELWEPPAERPAQGG